MRSLLGASGVLVALLAGLDMLLMRPAAHVFALRSGARPGRVLVALLPSLDVLFVRAATGVLTPRLRLAIPNGMYSYGSVRRPLRVAHASRLEFQTFDSPCFWDGRGDLIHGRPKNAARREWVPLEMRKPIEAAVREPVSGPATLDLRRRRRAASATPSLAAAHSRAPCRHTMFGSSPTSPRRAR